MNSRRMFLGVVPACAGMFVVQRVRSQTTVEPTDPQAMAVGFVKETARADATKYPRHTNDQVCRGCQLYTGGADAASAPCSLFGGKAVPAGGWCSAWVKKVG